MSNPFSITTWQITGSDITIRCQIQEEVFKDKFKLDWLDSTILASFVHDSSPILPDKDATWIASHTFRQVPGGASLKIAGVLQSKDNEVYKCRFSKNGNE